MLQAISTQAVDRSGPMNGSAAPSAGAALGRKVLTATADGQVSSK
jgi:hypothetical protein